MLRFSGVSTSAVGPAATRRMSTRATASGNVDQMRAIITLASPIVITKNSKVSVEMFFKGTNALAIEWSASSAAAGCTNISNVAPVFTIKTTITE